MIELSEIIDWKEVYIENPSTIKWSYYIEKTIETRNVIHCKQRHPSEVRDVQYDKQKGPGESIELSKVSELRDVHLEE
jgi:hypothetical protein